jgi:signal transduction histidine kinase
MDIMRNILLILKEGMNNILKHADAKNTTLSFELTEKVFRISLADDGKGFDCGKDYPGNGLQNMKSRASKIQIDLKLVSQSTDGTRIELFRKIPHNG